MRLSRFAVAFLNMIHSLFWVTTRNIAAIDRERKIHVLITEAGSYIGASFRSYAQEHYKSNFPVIDTVDLIDESWRNYEFKDEYDNEYDCVFHVTGIAYADVGNVTADEQEKYYEANMDLAIEVVKRSREAGCSQFVFMSSMIVYGDAESIIRHTEPRPANFYGD